MRLGIFGGSFDPVHSEHIAMAQSAIDCLRLDTLFIMPAHTPPHKQGKTLSDNAHRLALCSLAFENVPRAKVCDYEMKRGGTSYTYLTCEYFRTLYPDAELFWLVGTDMLRDFPTWKEPEKILSCVTLAVCARAEKSGWLEHERKVFYERFGKEFAVIDYVGEAVSSTQIRVLAGAGVDITPYVGEKCAEYIEREKLYHIPFAKEALSLEKESRRLHSIRVAEVSATRAKALGVDEKQAITAGLLHDCAKNLDMDSPYLRGFALPSEWGEVPSEVVHQFAGAYVCEHAFGVTDKEVLNAVRYHTSARVGMSALEKLIFLADMVEPQRNYEGVDELRAMFFEEKKGADGLDECLKKALTETVLHLKRKGGRIYPLTLQACEYYNQGEDYGKRGNE